MDKESTELQDSIKQVEKYIGESADNLSVEERNQYSEYKERFKQHRNEPKCKAKYCDVIREFEVTARLKGHDKVIDRQGRILDKMDQRIRKVSRTLDMMNKNSETRQKREQQCCTLLKKQNTMNKMLILFSVFAAVATTALICYTIFSQPSHILDNVTAKQSITSLVNSVL